MKFRRAEDRKMKFNRGDLCEARFHGNKWKKALVVAVHDASDFEKTALNLKQTDELWIYEVRYCEQGAGTQLKMHWGVR